MLPFLAVSLAGYGIYQLLTDKKESREVNFDLLCTGAPCEQTTRAIQKSLAALVKRHGAVKVGKTTNPSRRFQAQDYQEYDTMFVLYESSKAAHVGQYETHFITRFRQKLRNQHPHSTGRQPRRRVRRHFLYAAVSR